MLTNDVYSEPAAGVAQIGIRPRAHLPLLMLMGLVGNINFSHTLFLKADMAGPHTVMLV